MQVKTCILSRVKQITSPGWMHETSAPAWCPGKTRGIGWRGRWEGGSGWGTHVTPGLIHVNVWQNPLQCCKVISLQLIKINGKKKKKKEEHAGTCSYGLVKPEHRFHKDKGVQGHVTQLTVVIFSWQNYKCFWFCIFLFSKFSAQR